MSAVLLASPAELLRVRVAAEDPVIQRAVLGMLRGPEVAVVDGPEFFGDTVVLVAARTVDEALAACPPRVGGSRLAVMADSFSRDEVRRALRAGASTMLRLTGTTHERLVAALHAVRDGDGRMPHEVLVRLLGSVRDDDAPAWPAATPPRLTARQVAMLRLMADGLGNADIAGALSCSEHTVKNVIYELMARLHARNRAHAVASAVRLGIV